MGLSLAILPKVNGADCSFSATQLLFILHLSYILDCSGPPVITPILEASFSDPENTLMIFLYGNDDDVK